MWTIEKPQITALEAFDTCRDGITDIPLKKRLGNIRIDVAKAESEFDGAARKANLLSVKATLDVGGQVTADEMGKLYERHMVRERSRGRPIYDNLMIAAPFDQCPFCGHQIVSTIDHCLPKAQHPALAITPLNLIPCCKDCNHNKGSLVLACESDQLLNAYFDNVTKDSWLFAKIIEASPPGARFYVEKPSNWNSTIAKRVGNHFTKLKLARLYASQAGRQLQNMRAALTEIYDAAGINAVREDLERQCRSCKHVSLNSWQSALMQAAATSDWYCDAGFRA